MQVNINPTDQNIAPLAQFNISDLLRTGIQTLLIIAVLAFIIYLLIGGFKWITSGGDKEGLSKASKKISHSLIGLIILFSTFGVVRAFSVFTDINLFCVEIPGIGASWGNCPRLTGGLLNPGTSTPIPTVFEGIRACYTNSDCLASAPICNRLNQFGSPNDSDGDGFAPPPEIGMIGGCLTWPIDCNDDNVEVNPDQISYFTTPIEGTGTNYDYNCSGTNDKLPSLNCLTTIQQSTIQCQREQIPDSIGQAGWVGQVPECGSPLDNRTYLWRDCFYSSYSCIYGNGGSFQATCNAAHLCPSASEIYTPTGNNINSWAITTTSFQSFNLPVNGYSIMPCR